MLIGLEMIVACAPSIAPQTVQQIIAVESKWDPLALNVNGATLSRKPRDAADAVALAYDYIAAGYTVDMGLMQVNSANLPKLGYTVEDMFDPCKNLRAGSTLLMNFYQDALTHYPDEQLALRAALSAYNTGSYTRGFKNGYVAQYYDGQPSRKAAPVPHNPFTATTVVYIRKQIGGHNYENRENVAHNQP